MGEARVPGSHVAARWRAIASQAMAGAALACGVSSANAAGFDGAALTLYWILPFVGILASIARESSYGVSWIARGHGGGER